MYFWLQPPFLVWRGNDYVAIKNIRLPFKEVLNVVSLRNKPNSILKTRIKNYRKHGNKHTPLDWGHYFL